MISNFMSEGNDMDKVVSVQQVKVFTWYNDGYHTYYSGGGRGDCRHPLFSEAYECWHEGFSQAEKEDQE